LNLFQAFAALLVKEGGVERWCGSDCDNITLRAVHDALENGLPLIVLSRQSSKAISVLIGVGFVVSELLSFGLALIIFRTLRANVSCFSPKTYRMHVQMTTLIVLQARVYYVTSAIYSSLLDGENVSCFSPVSFYLTDMHAHRVHRVSGDGGGILLLLYRSHEQAGWRVGNRAHSAGCSGEHICDHLFCHSVPTVHAGAIRCEPPSGKVWSLQTPTKSFHKQQQQHPVGEQLPTGGNGSSQHIPGTPSAAERASSSGRREQRKVGSIDDGEK
jgi:hypothetical protein